MRLERNDEALVALDAALKIDPTHAWSLAEKKRLRSLGVKAARALEEAHHSPSSTSFPFHGSFLTLSFCCSSCSIDFTPASFPVGAIVFACSS